MSNFFFLLLLHLRPCLGVILGIVVVVGDEKNSCMYCNIECGFG